MNAGATSGPGHISPHGAQLKVNTCEYVLQ